MFEASIKTTKLAEAVDVAEALVEEAVLVFTDDGLEVTVIDAATVGMGAVDIPQSDFETYETDGARLGVFVETVSDVIGLLNEDDVLSLVLDEETRKLVLSSNGLEYTMALLDPDSIETMDELPDLEFDAKATIETPKFNRVVTAADMVGDYLTLTVSDGAFSIGAQGDDDDIGYDATDAEISPGNTGSVEDAESMFSLSYFDSMFNSINGEYVSVSVADDMPVRLDFKLADSDGSGVFFVAPRISND